MRECPTGDWPGRGFCRALVLLVALAALVPAMGLLIGLSLCAALLRLITGRPAANPWFPVLVWMRHLRAVLRVGDWLEDRLGAR